jgi:hypothetical protein
VAIDERSYGSNQIDVAIDLNNLIGVLLGVNRLRVGIQSPIVREVENLLGPVKPRADNLPSRDLPTKEQGSPNLNLLNPKEPITPHFVELLPPNGNALNIEGVRAASRCAWADALVRYEAALRVMADEPAQIPIQLLARMNQSAARR